jgi:hypothetical protein
MRIPQRVARHMEIAAVLGIGVDSLLDTVAYLTGESDTPPEFSPRRSPPRSTGCNE